MHLWPYEDLNDGNLILYLCLAAFEILNVSSNCHVTHGMLVGHDLLELAALLQMEANQPAAIQQQLQHMHTWCTKRVPELMTEAQGVDQPSQQYQHLLSESQQHIDKLEALLTESQLSEESQNWLRASAYAVYHTLYYVQGLLQPDSSTGGAKSLMQLVEVGGHLIAIAMVNRVSDATSWGVVRITRLLLYLDVHNVTAEVSIQAELICQCAYADPTKFLIACPTILVTHPGVCVRSLHACSVLMLAGVCALLCHSHCTGSTSPGGCHTALWC